MRDMVAVLGAETPSGRAVAKKLRAERYCCKLLHSGVSAREVAALDPAGVLLAGEESEGAQVPDPEILSLRVPVLALGSSARSLCAVAGRRTSGEAIVQSVVPVRYASSPLFEDIGPGERWIGHAEPFLLPEPYRAIAEVDGYPVAFADEGAQHYLLQFQIERNDPDGIAILLAFAGGVAGCTAWWSPESIVAEAEKTIKAAVGEGYAICAMSGGLDSTVAAVLAKRVLGERLLCIYVDTGLMRKGETEEIVHYFQDVLSLRFVRVDASGPILRALAGLTEARDKWRVIDNEISRALMEEAEKLPGEKSFIRGTNYVDVVGDARDAVPARQERAVEPLRELFKDEIRMIGEYLQLAPSVLSRQPFPGMGLAARVHGNVTAARLTMLRTADAIFTDELMESGQDRRLTRYFAMLDEIGGRDTIVLRATNGMEPQMSVARLPYDLLERTVARIQKALPSVARVLYDMTPGMAEWP